jgi:hypothetical protein
MSGVNAHAVLAAPPTPRQPRDAAAPGGASSAVPPPALVLQRHDLLRAAGLPCSHPLLFHASAAAGSSSAAVEFAVPLAARPNLAFLSDHHVSGRALLPAAAFLEMGAAAARALLLPDGGRDGGLMPAPVLTGAVLAAPLLLPLPGDGEEDAGMLVLTCSMDPAAGALSISSSHLQSGGSAAGRPTVHVRAAVGSTANLHKPAAAAAVAADGSSSASSVDAQRAACSTPVDMAAAYAAMSSAGLQYGPAFRRLRAAQQGAGQSVGQLAHSRPGTDDGFAVHPAVLDSLLQLGTTVPEPAAAGSDGQQSAMLPAAVALFVAQAAGCDVTHPSHLFGLAKRGANGSIGSSASSHAGAAAPSTLRDHALFGSTGGLMCVVDGLEARAARWQLQPAATAAGHQTQQGVEDSQMLHAIEWAVDRSADESAAAPAVAGSSRFNLQLAAGGGSGGGAAAAALAALQVLPSGTAVAAAGVLALSPGGPVSGLLRSWAQERPSVGLSAWQADAHAAHSTTTRQPLAAALAVLPSGAFTPAAADAYGDQAVSGAVRVPVLLSTLAAPTTGPYNLTPRPRGALGNLVPVAVNARPDREGTVMLSVKAVGLNFRDVLNVSCL